MEPVTFLSTSPTFMLVSNGLIHELRDLISFECQRTNETDPFLKGNRTDHPNYFGKWYDFSRTATSVLRMLMLGASGMKKHCDPEFNTKPQNLSSCREGVAGPCSNMDMAHGSSYRAERIVAEFDRLFPHRIIEYELKDIQLEVARTFSGKMYVIYFGEPGTIYQIDATMSVNMFPLDEGMEIEAYSHVVVAKYKFRNPSISPSNESEFKRYMLLKQLIEEWSESRNPTDDLPPTAALAGLNLSEH